MFGGGQPVIVLNSNTKREQGKKVQLGNITAAKTVAGVIRWVWGKQSNARHGVALPQGTKQILILFVYW